MAKTITTLYISDTDIRLMVSRGKRIIKAAEAPLDMNLAEVGDKVKEAEIAAKVKQLFKVNKVGEKKIVVGLSGLHCLSRPMVLPQLPRAMLDEAVIREAGRVLPVPPEQLYISWQVISVAEGKMQAFMVAIPCEDADGLLRILQRLGLKPYLMDIKPLALAKLVPEATAVVVDVQTKEFDIVIMADGIPQPVRTVSFPEAALSLEDRLPAVRDELRRTIQFYNANNPARPIQNEVTLYISGELAANAALSESLAKALGYRVIPLPSPMKCPKHLDPARYLVNIGLALKELPREDRSLLPNLNTLPVPYQPRQISLGKIMALPAAAVAIGLIVLLAMNVQDTAASVSGVQSQLDATNLVLDQRQAQRKELAGGTAALQQELTNTQAATNAFIAALDSLNRDGDRVDGDLKATVDDVVSNLSLSGINHSGEGLNVSGTAPSEVEVLEYARRLYSSGRFAALTIASIRVKAGDEAGGGSVNTTVEFSLVLTLKAAK